MGNVYIYDLLFVALFLWNKTKYLTIKDCEFSRYFYWAEAIIILLYLFVRPCHTDSEKAVSFFMQLITMLLWYLLYYRKKINNRNF